MKNSIQSISIVGSGNVAHHLGKALSAKGLIVSLIVSRNESTGTKLAQDLNTVYSKELHTISSCDLVLLCVPDDSIADILINLPSSHSVAYTSGSVDINSLPKRDQLGVFYPLQSFSKESDLQYDRIPFFIEAKSNKFEQQLVALARSISSNVKVADSEYRKNLHLAAVWVNNFTNHILYNAMSICNERKVDFISLMPLLEETINKISHQTPYDAQTGPARRNDIGIINDHLEQLKGNQKEIYRILTESIRNTYNND